MSSVFDIDNILLDDKLDCGHNAPRIVSEKANMPSKRSPETGPVTMEDIARLAGVSTITVSRALRDSPLVTGATRDKIRQLAAEQGYRMNLSARNLRTGRSHSVAVVVEMTPERGRPMSAP